MLQPLILLAWYPKKILYSDQNVPLLRAHRSVDLSGTLIITVRFMTLNFRKLAAKICPAAVGRYLFQT